jgi:hypothetical protein
MWKEYDFSKARLNPYAKRLKRSTTVRIDDEAKLTRRSDRKRPRRPPSGS